jgi:hypothetical protein
MECENAVMINNQSENCEPYLYRGEVDAKGIMKGFGEIVFKNGGEYFGEVQKFIHGFGTMTYTKGMKLEGYHDENGFNGLGRVTNTDTNMQLYGIWTTKDKRQLDFEGIDDWLQCFKAMDVDTFKLMLVRKISTAEEYDSFWTLLFGNEKMPDPRLSRLQNGTENSESEYFYQVPHEFEKDTRRCCFEFLNDGCLAVKEEQVRQKEIAKKNKYRKNPAPETENEPISFYMSLQTKDMYICERCIDKPLE